MSPFRLRIDPHFDSLLLFMYSLEFIIENFKTVVLSIFVDFYIVQFVMMLTKFTKIIQSR